jgi:predicted membrane chloride channel (bestrophin family)
MSTISIVIATAISSYVLIGIDEVGMEIENAFQLLPLQQLSANLQNAVRDSFVNEMPPVPHEQSKLLP